MQQLVMKAKALADPTRLKLLRLLAERECAVQELVSVLATGQSRVSQHLARLKAAGLVRERREGRWVYYAANPDAVLGLDRELLELIDTPVEQVPGMRAEGRRWRRLAGPNAPDPRAGADGAIPVAFRPEPAPARGRPRAAAARRPSHILFLCTANSFRSQIAEAWTRVLGGGRVEVQSAGLEPTRLHPLAEAIMREVGVEMAGQYAKGITPQLIAEADVMITLCGGALGWFPLIPRDVRRQHWPFPDPAAVAGPEEAVLREGRKVRDGIRRRVEALLTSLEVVA